MVVGVYTDPACDGVLSLESKRVSNSRRQLKEILVAYIAHLGRMKTQKRELVSKTIVGSTAGLG